MTRAATSPFRLPDFIIGGAPKCGTTSVHFILGQNPSIGLPDEEIHYFDADDPITHPDFLHVQNGTLEWFDTSAVHTANLEWYRQRFHPFADMPIVGEDSTTYLFSEAAPERIKALLPDAKLIFMLRDPVKRAYSQYWHLICSGRLTCSFEEGLLRHTSIILGSTYAPHLARYLKVFGEEKVKAVIFEDFIGDQQAQINDITDYLTAPRMDLATAQTWFNQTSYPTHPKAQQWLNWVGSKVVAKRYRNHMGGNDGWADSMRRKTHYRWFRYINPILLKAPKPPPMQDVTRTFLQQHLSARNAGLSDMMGRDLSKVWQGFTG